uniref:monocarboxylate transporter 2-like isoform X1 n=1 Tax=Ciona intestinalis TaxID=7719 RepID=UPI0002B8D81B|nr:monocarboxylate transporter 2-like isoform X1 [Ciona intestinalis]|eukprot:XP_018666671.1 monocarboxylate transporter 2-like isoform X1 [Ciona intestinalis]
MPESNDIDGGWGWCVVTSAVIFCAIRTGVDRCLSVLYSGIMNEYNCDYSTVSQIPGLFYVGYAVSGLIASPLIKRFGYRLCMIVAGLVGSISCFVASLPGPFMKIAIFYGIFLGFCIGLQIVCVLTAITDYFKEKLNFASQLMYVGYSVGPFIACPLFQVMVDFYTWKGTLMILSGIILNSVVTGTIMRPIIQKPESQLVKMEQSLEESAVQKVEYSENVTRLSKTSADEDSLSWQHKLAQQFDLHLFCTLRFHILILQHTMNYIAMSAAFMFLIPYGIELGTISKTEASFLTSAEAIGEIIAKLGFMFFFTKIPVHRQKLFICFLYTINIVLFAILPSVQGYPGLLANAFGIGVAAGGIDGVYSVFCIELFAQKYFSSILGYTNTFSFCLCTATALFVGYLIDVTGKLSSAFYFGSLSYGAAFLLMLLLHRITR